MLGIGGEPVGSVWERDIVAAALVENIHPELLALEEETLLRVLVIYRRAYEELGVWATDGAKEYLRARNHA